MKNDHKIDIGLVWLKNYHARDIARREATLIAHDMAEGGDYNCLADHLFEVATSLQIE